MPLPLIPIALAGASLLGGILGGGKKKQTQTTNTTSSPTLDPAFSGLRDVLLRQSMKSLRMPSFGPQYESQGISRINDTYRVGQQGLNASLTSRGLAGSPVAGNALAQSNDARLGSIVGFQNQIPELERQAQMQNFAAASGLMSNAYGQTTNTTTTGESGGGLGDRIGGGLSGLGGMLGFLMANGGMGGGAAQTQSGLPTFFGLGRRS